MPALQDQPLVETVAVPQHYQPATARERRAQAIKRLQVGAGGIAAMLLIVGLANIIMDRARQNADVADAVPKAVQSEKAPAIDPLADIGLMPSPDPSPDSQPSHVPTEPVLP
jgi:hypothetical protein